jgi:hypothetical protein
VAEIVRNKQENSCLGLLMALQGMQRHLSTQHHLPDPHLDVHNFSVPMQLNAF